MYIRLMNFVVHDSVTDNVLNSKLKRKNKMNEAKGSAKQYEKDEDSVGMGELGGKDGLSDDQIKFLDPASLPSAGWLHYIPTLGCSITMSGSKAVSSLELPALRALVRRYD